MMKGFALALLGLSALFAADEQQLALALRARSDFDRVESRAIPLLEDANTCVQSQAGVLPVTTPEDLPLVHYRKGYCALAAAYVTSDRRGYLAAAAEFDKAIENWPLQFRSASKKRAPGPVS